MAIHLNEKGKTGVNVKHVEKFTHSHSLTKSLIVVRQHDVAFHRAEEVRGHLATSPNATLMLLARQQEFKVHAAFSRRVVVSATARTASSPTPGHVLDTFSAILPLLLSLILEPFLCLKNTPIDACTDDNPVRPAEDDDCDARAQLAIRRSIRNKHWEARRAAGSAHHPPRHGTKCQQPFTLLASRRYRS